MNRFNCPNVVVCYWMNHWVFRYSFMNACNNPITGLKHWVFILGRWFSLDTLLGVVAIQQSGTASHTSNGAYWRPMHGHIVVHMSDRCMDAMWGHAHSHRHRLYTDHPMALIYPCYIGPNIGILVSFANQCPMAIVGVRGWVYGPFMLVPAVVQIAKSHPYSAYLYIGHTDHCQCAQPCHLGVLIFGYACLTCTCTHAWNRQG